MNKTTNQLKRAGWEKTGHRIHNKEKAVEEQDLPRFHRTQTRDICLFIYSLFPTLNCTICAAMKKGIEKTVFLDSLSCCYLFGKHVKGQNKIVHYSPRSPMNKKKKGRKRGRWAGKKGTRVSSRDWQQFHKTFHFSRRRHQNKGDNNFLVRK